MLDGEEHKAPGELLEELDVLRELDARDEVAEAIVGEMAGARDRSGAAARRRVWLGLRLALIVAIGVVLIVAALFRYVVPGEPTEQPATQSLPTERPQPVEPPVVAPVAPETASPPTEEAELAAELIQAQVSQVLKWQLRIEEDHISFPAFGPDGSLCLTAYTQEDRSSSLYSITPDGAVKWRHQFDGFIKTSTPLVGPNGTAYVYDRRGSAYAIDNRGRLLWEVDPGGEHVGMTVDPHSGVLYLAREGGNLLTRLDDRKRKAYDSVVYAVSRRGQVTWERVLPGDTVQLSTSAGPDAYGRGLVVGPDGTLYVSTRHQPGTPSSLRAFEPSGTPMWQSDLVEEDYAVLTAIAFGPGGDIYAATKTSNTDRGSLYALDSGGGLKWVAAIDVINYACPLVAADGTVCIRCRPYEVNRDTHQLRALNPADGSELWHVPGRGSEVVLAPDGTIYFPTQSGLMAITPSGTIRWHNDRIKGEPLVAPDGLLYAGGHAISKDGHLLYQLPLSGGLTVDHAGNFYSVSRDGEIFALRE